MAGDSLRVPLLLRTVQTIRERFAALRSVGTIEAVMEEFPRGSKPKGEPRQDSLPFHAEGGVELRCWGGAVVGRADEASAVRSVWLGCDFPTQGRLLRICRDANGFVPFVRQKFGLPEDCGTDQPEARWIWTVFELAEAQPPFTVLALGKHGGPFRYTAGGKFCSPERGIEAAKNAPPDAHPFLRFSGLFEYLPSRYWQLPDLVEASIAVMDMIEVAIPSLDEETEEGPPAGDEGAKAEGGDEEPEDTTKADRGQRGPTTDERLIELEKTEGGREFAETATEKELAESIGRKPGAFTNSYHFQNNLRPRREKRRAEAQMANSRKRFASSQELRSRLRDEDRGAAREHFERLEALDSAIDGGH